jgi:CBS domain-containing membrane protein
MTTDVVTVTAGQSLPLVEDLMKQGRFRHLPVVNTGGQLVGLVTHRDLLAAKLTVLDGRSDDERSSDELVVPIAQVMQTEVWTIGPLAPALSAARTLSDHRFGCLPVVEEGRLVGIVTEADFLELLTDSLELGDPAIVTVEQAMTASPIVAKVTDTLGDARALMDEHGIRHLPILGEDDAPVGILSDRELRVAEAIGGGRLRAANLALSLLGTNDPYVVEPESALGPVLLDMAAQQIGSALVAKAGHLVGIVTATDACELYGAHLQACSYQPTRG